MKMYQVWYRGKETFSDMCAGVPFEIVGGEKKHIDEIAARHIFGFGEDSKERALTRLGWLRSGGKSGPGGWDEAMAKLGQFVFTELELATKTDGTGNAELLSSAGKKVAA
jgi:hypothetical protein